MKSKLLITLSTLFCLLTLSMQVSAQVPPPSGDDGDDGGDPVIFYYACTNSDGTAVFTRVRLSPQEAAALCDDDNGDGDGGLTPTGN